MTPVAGVTPAAYVRCVDGHLDACSGAAAVNSL